MDLNKLFNISDEVILLLGFTGPIGRQFATVFAESGCTLVLGDNSENGRDLAESIKKMNRNTEYIRLDVTDETDVRDAVSYVAEKYGLISVLVNNFSARPEGFYKKFEDSELGCWNEVLNVNLSAMYLSSREVSKVMMRQGYGSIINVSSVHGVIAPDQRVYGGSGLNSPAVYASSKSGVIGLTRYLAAYLGKYNIRVNSICPGGVNPGNVDKGFVDEYSTRIPLNRMADMEDMKGPVVFLASQASRFVTGQSIIVDGGQSIW
ncbi:MAG: hypothetical protein A2054_11255 [Deltaproteobacteria bacterium GWA2_55_10]|nr:MAG: hypothetical protein A2054_11255 [Deltaproteobacteria bacterium GWA2_55_10]